MISSSIRSPFAQISFNYFLIFLNLIWTSLRKPFAVIYYHNAFTHPHNHLHIVFYQQDRPSLQDRLDALNERAGQYKDLDELLVRFK